MEEEKPNYYAIIPANIRYDENLRANEKLLYGEITALTYKTGECWASNNYFARLYKTTPQAISRWILNLKKLGYLEISYEYLGKEIQKRIIKVSTNIDTYQQNDDRGINICLGGYQQNVKENNTSINNTSINKKEIYKESWDCDEYVNTLTEAVIDYLNEKTERNYKPKNQKTRTLVKARLRDGFTELDFLNVIDTKCKDWLDTDMEKYLRPETLFGTKFENYVNERKKK